MTVRPLHYAQALLELCVHKTHAQIDASMSEFVALMRNRGQGKVAWAVLDALRRCVVKRGNGELITVTVSHDLEKTEREALDKELRTAFGKASAITFSYDERLLGGMRLTVGDTVYDDSAATRLAALKKQLLISNP